MYYKSLRVKCLLTDYLLVYCNGRMNYSNALINFKINNIVVIIEDYIKENTRDYFLSLEKSVLCIK